MACCVVLQKLPDVITDEFLREKLNTSPSTSKTYGQKPRLSPGVSSSSSDRHKSRSKREDVASPPKHVNAFKAPNHKQPPQQKCNSNGLNGKDARRKKISSHQEPGKSDQHQSETPEVVVLSDSGSDAIPMEQNESHPPDKKLINSESKGKSELESRASQLDLLPPQSRKSTRRSKRIRASSVEWDWSGSESAGPSNVPQNKSKKKTRKRNLSDSSWEDPQNESKKRTKNQILSDSSSEDPQNKSKKRSRNQISSDSSSEDPQNKSKKRTRNQISSDSSSEDPQNKSKKRTRKRNLSRSSRREVWASTDSDNSDSEPNALSKVCYVCDKTFRRPFLLMNHLRTHSNSEKYPFSCDEKGCTKGYTHKHHLERHKSISHSDLVLVCQTKCPAEGCGRLYSSGCGLKRHINSKHSGKRLKFPCSECDMDFRKLKQLRYHMAEHTGLPPLKCDICGARAYSTNEMKRHQRTHKKYNCDVAGCDQVFSNYPLLRKHIAEHNRCFQSLRCAHCNKEFTTKYNLRVHVMTHVENKPIFKCTYGSCPRFYYQERNLKCHIRLKHERKSTFVCSWPDCDKIFYSKAALTKHINIHENGKAPMTKRKEGPKAKRKDAGKPKRAMASKLAGVTLPRDVEKKLLGGDVCPSVIEAECEKDELHGIETSIEDLENPSKIVQVAKEQKNKPKKHIQWANLSAVDQLVVAEVKQNDEGVKMVPSMDEKEANHPGKTSNEQLMQEMTNTQNVQSFESPPENETSLAIEESDERVGEIISTVNVEGIGNPPENETTLAIEESDERVGEIISTVNVEGIENPPENETTLVIEESDERVGEIISTVNVEGIENPPENETTLVIEESDERILALSGRTFEVGEGGVLVEVGSTSEMLDQETNTLVSWLDDSYSISTRKRSMDHNLPDSTPKDSSKVGGSRSPMNNVPVNIPELNNKNGSEVELSGADQDDRSGEKSTDLNENNCDEQELRLNIPLSMADYGKDINRKESNVKVFCDAPVANLMDGADMNSLCATLCTQTVVEGPSSHAGVEIFIVIPSTAGAGESYVTDPTFQDDQKSDEISTAEENFATNPFSKSASVSIKTVYLEQIHKLATSEPHVASVLQPFLQNLPKNVIGCEEHIKRSVASASSSTLTSVPAKAQYESAVTKLAKFIRNPFVYGPTNIHKSGGSAKFQEHLQGPRQDTADSDGSSGSDSENFSAYGSDDDEHNESNDENDEDEGDADDDLSEANDNNEENDEDDEDDNDEDDHTDEGDDGEEGDEDDDNNNDDEGDGNNNGINQLNGNHDNNDVNDNDNSSSNESGRQVDQDSAGDKSIGGSEMGIDRTQNSRLQVQDDCDKEECSVRGIDVCGDDDEELKPLLLPVSEDSGDEDTLEIKTSPTCIISGSDVPALARDSGDEDTLKIKTSPACVISGSDAPAPASAVNEPPVIAAKRHTRSMESGPNNVAQANITSAQRNSKNVVHKRVSLKPKEIKDTTKKQKKVPPGKPIAQRASKQKATQKQPIRKRDLESSSDSEPVRRKKQRICNIGDDSDDSNAADPLYLPTKVENSANPACTNGPAVIVENSFENELEALKSIRDDSDSKTACSRLSESAWINILRQVTKSRKLSSIVVED